MSEDPRAAAFEVHEPRPAPGGDLDRRAYFLHIPKTAGTTVDAYLQSMYAPEEICPAQLWDALLCMPREQLQTYRFFHGHFGGALCSLLEDEPAVLTMLREPRARTVAAFRHLKRDATTRRRPVGPRYAELARSSPDFATFLRHPYARLLVENTQARHLAVDDLPAEVVSGSIETDEAQTRFELAAAPPDDELEERALARLERCAWVGTTEQFEASMRLLAWVMRWSYPGQLVALNVGHNQVATCTSAADEDLIAELTRVDRVVYQTATRLVEQRWASYVAAKTATWCDEHLARRAVPLVRELTISAGAPRWGGGWWPREIDPVDGACIAWTGPGTRAWVDVPIVLTEGAVVEVRLRYAMPTVAVERTTLEVNGIAQRTEVLPGAGGIWLARMIVPACAVGQWTRVVVCSAGVGFDTGHERGGRGLAVESFTFRPAHH